jgi:hypothetical protein
VLAVFFELFYFWEICAAGQVSPPHSEVHRSVECARANHMRETDPVLNGRSSVVFGRFDVMKTCPHFRRRISGRDCSLTRSHNKARFDQNIPVSSSRDCCKKSISLFAHLRRYVPILRTSINVPSRSDSIGIAVKRVAVRPYGRSVLEF